MVNKNERFAPVKTPDQDPEGFFSKAIKNVRSSSALDNMAKAARFMGPFQLVFNRAYETVMRDRSEDDPFRLTKIPQYIYRGITGLPEQIAADITTAVSGGLSRERREKIKQGASLVDIYRDFDLPFGVKGALETLPMFAIPSAAVTRGALLARAAILSKSAKATERAAAAVLKTAAAAAKPVAVAEELTGKAVAVPLRGLGKLAARTPGLKRLARSGRKPEPPVDTGKTVADSEEVTRMLFGERPGPGNVVAVNAMVDRALHTAAESGTKTSGLRAPRMVQEVTNRLNTIPRGVTRWLAWLAGGKFINPTAFVDDQVARYALGTNSLKVQTRHQVEMQAQSIFDASVSAMPARLNKGRLPSAGKYGGRMESVIPIDKNGIYKGTNFHILDIMENPNNRKWRKAVTEETRQIIDKVRNTFRDMNKILVANGLPARALTNAEDGWFYFPRHALGKEGVNFAKTSNPYLARVIESATEGTAQGVNYNNNVREVFKLHLTAAYDEILQKQFSDAIEPLTFLPSKLIPKDVYIERAATLATYRRIQHEVRREIQAEATRLGKAPMPSTFIKKVEKDLGVKEAKSAYSLAKAKWGSELKRAKLATVAPNNMFGFADDAQIPITLWRGRFMPRKSFIEAKKVADDVLREWGVSKKDQGTFERVAEGFEKSVNISRMLAATFDVALPFIHGMPLLFRNPQVWARGTYHHYKALFQPKMLGKMVDENRADFDWLAQHGIGIDSEFFAALQKGGSFSMTTFFKKFPKGEGADRFWKGAVNQTFGRFQSAYNTGLASYRVQLLQSIRKNWYANGGTPEQLAAYIRNMTGALDSRLLGVGPTQRRLESMWLAFSPRLLRSTAALMGDAIRGATAMGARAVGAPVAANLQHREALKTVASFLAAVHGIYLTTGLAMGKSEEELQRGLNPLEGKRYLSHQVNGDWIGVGGQIRGLMQFVAKSVDALRPGGQPIEDFLDLTDQYENPLVNFYMNRGAPAMRVSQTLVEGLSGSFGGDKINAMPYDHIDGGFDLVKHLAQSALPFTIQGIVEGEKTMTTAFAFTGMRTSPESPSEKRRRIRNAETAKAFSAGLLTQVTTELTPEARAKAQAGDYSVLARDAQIIVDNLPGVKAAIVEYQEKRRDLGDQYQIYLDEKTEINKSYDDLITARAKKVPPSLFREQLGDIKRERGWELSNLNDRHEETLKFFADLEPVENKFSIALTEYYKLTNDHELEDPETGRFKFDELDRRKEGFRNDWGAHLTDRIEDYIRINEHELETELRQARELLREYWEAPPIDDPQLKKQWDLYRQAKTENPTMAAQMKRRSPILKVLEKRQRRIRDRLRRNPEIDKALVKWYPRVARTSLGFEIAEQLGQEFLLDDVSA
jgi:hypothetical protein